MRVHFDAILSSHAAVEKTLTEWFLYMSYWYAGLYVVIEGWRDLKFSDPVIDNLLQSPNVQLLRRYRNGTFHFQREYFDERFTDFTSSTGTVVWVRNLNTEFGRYFLEAKP
jgi:hypothetical protein